MMRFTYKLWAFVASAFCLGVFAGLLLPPICLVVVEGVLLLFIAICKICG